MLEDIPKATTCPSIIHHVKQVEWLWSQSPAENAKYKEDSWMAAPHIRTMEHRLGVSLMDSDLDG